MTIRILLDGKTLQIMAHLKHPLINEDGTVFTNPDTENFRLKTFLELLNSIGSYTITQDFLTAELLSKYDIFVVLTRYEPYAQSEREVIYDFVKSGGNLLLMSNHAPFHKFDAKLTSKFGVKLLGGYWSGKKGVFTILTGEDLTDHSILIEYTEKIDSIVTNSTCRIVSNYGRPIAYLPDSMVPLPGIEEEAIRERKLFGLSIDRASSDLDINGNVVILADSGFIGEKGSTYPGFGLMEEGDNLLFIKRIFSYLTGLEFD